MPTRRPAGGGALRLAGLDDLETGVVMRATMTVMWQVRLLMRLARPRARGRNRFSVGPSSAKQASDEQLVGVLLVVVLGVGDGAGEHLADVVGDARGR